MKANFKSHKETFDDPGCLFAAHLWITTQHTLRLRLATKYSTVFGVPINAFLFHTKSALQTLLTRK